MKYLMQIAILLAAVAPLALAAEPPAPDPVDAAFAPQLEALAPPGVFDPGAGIGPRRLAVTGRFRGLVRLCNSGDVAVAGVHSHFQDDCPMAAGA